MTTPSLDTLDSAPLAESDFAQPAPIRWPQPPLVSGSAWLAIAVASVLANLALRTDIAALAGTLSVLIVAGPVLASLPHRSRASHLFAGAAAVFGVWLMLRASLALAALNTMAVLVCLVASAVLARATPIGFDTTTLRTLFARTCTWWLFPMVLAQLGRPLRSARSAQFAPVLRGLAIAALPVAVLGALLASADVVFAESFTPNIDVGSWFGHAVLTAMMAATIAGLIAMSSESERSAQPEWRPLGSTEALMLLGSIAVLYAVFAVVQIASAFGGADRILAERGVTYAEYARTGFFQLLWVAALTVVLLVGVRVLVTDQATRSGIAVRGLGAVVSLLTIGIVAVAIRRLDLYTEAFGQTGLRWYCTAFAWMLGVAFLLIAAAHLHRFETYLPGALAVLAVATLLAVNVVNPEARIAQHNLTRADAAEKLDTNYLLRLSADAWPTIVQHEDVIAANTVAGDSMSRRCANAAEPPGYGVFGFNLARARLNCPTP